MGSSASSLVKPGRAPEVQDTVAVAPVHAAAWAHLVRPSYVYIAMYATDSEELPFTCRIKVLQAPLSVRPKKGYSACARVSCTRADLQCNRCNAANTTLPAGGHRCECEDPDCQKTPNAFPGVHSNWITPQVSFCTFLLQQKKTSEAG